MQKLASEYGISGNGLAKICDRLQVPYPSRGHWAKKAASKPTTIRHLTAATGDTPHKVVITPTPKLLQTGNPGTDTSPTVIVVEVPHRLACPHPIVAAMIKDRKTRRSEYLSLRSQRAVAAEKSPWRYQPFVKEVPPVTEVDKRTFRILDALFKAAENAGGTVGVRSDREAFITFLDQQFCFEISKFTRATNQAPINGLQLTISNYFDRGARRSWRDGKRRTLEAQLSEFLQTLTALAPILSEKGRIAREEHKRHMEHLRLREDRERNERLQNNRWKRLVSLSQDWSTWQRVQAFISALESSDSPQRSESETKETSNWLAWAKQQLTDRNPMSLGASAIFNFVDKANDRDS